MPERGPGRIGGRVIPDPHGLSRRQDLLKCHTEARSHREKTAVLCVSVPLCDKAVQPDLVRGEMRVRRGARGAGSKSVGIGWESDRIWIWLGIGIGSPIGSNREIEDAVGRGRGESAAVVWEFASELAATKARSPPARTSRTCAPARRRSAGTIGGPPRHRRIVTGAVWTPESASRPTLDDPLRTRITRPHSHRPATKDRPPAALQAGAPV